MTGTKLAALTFDDGPDLGITLPLLDLLREAGVPASFFVVGEQITPQTEAVIRRAAEQGCEIGNHSFSHPDMSAMTEEEIRSQISRTSEAVQRITGQAPRFFRPPYIAVSEEMFRTVGLPMICGFGCDDYDPAVSTEARVSRTLAQLRDGAVILLHDAKDNVQTVEAVRLLLPQIAARGYSLVTVSELFARKQIVPQKRIIYSFAEQTTMYA